MLRRAMARFAGDTGDGMSGDRRLVATRDQRDIVVSMLHRVVTRDTAVAMSDRLDAKLAGDLGRFGASMEFVERARVRSLFPDSDFRGMAFDAGLISQH